MLVVECRSVGHEARLKCAMPEGWNWSEVDDATRVLHEFRKLRRDAKSGHEQLSREIEIPLHLIDLAGYRTGAYQGQLFLDLMTKADPLAGLRSAFAKIVGSHSPGLRDIADTAARAVDAAIHEHTPPGSAESVAETSFHFGGIEYLAPFFVRHPFLWQVTADYVKFTQRQLRSVCWPQALADQLDVDELRCFGSVQLRYAAQRGAPASDVSSQPDRKEGKPPAGRPAGGLPDEPPGPQARAS